MDRIPNTEMSFNLLFEASFKSMATRFHIFAKILTLDFNLVHCWQRDNYLLPKAAIKFLGAFLRSLSSIPPWKLGNVWLLGLIVKHDIYLEKILIRIYRK